jgi:hypothetical protein
LVGDSRREPNPQGGTPRREKEMKPVDAKHFHKLYGVRKQRITYQDMDFLDYVIASLISASLIWFAYGPNHVLLMVGLALFAFMIATFPMRHGVQLRVPLVLVRPQEILYSLIHKIQNIKPPYFIALGVLLIENYIIFLTPDLPHEVELMHKIAVYLFWGHFIIITIYRTAILTAHLRKRQLVREILTQSIWRTSLERQPSVVLHILHAYFTGILTHIVYLVPWYLVITYFNFSILLLPATCLVAFLIQRKSVKQLNHWFYRDHWLGHNSEFDFVYLHGSHHDAIPCGLIGVAGNGFLEGFFRGALAFPIPFYSPVMAAIFYTLDVKIDMDLHQYIPGIFPKLSREFYGVIQHSIHHYGRVEPYGFAINLDQPNISDNTRKQFRSLPDELKYSIKLDEELTGYEWDNARFRWFLDLVDKYQNGVVKK